MAEKRGSDFSFTMSHTMLPFGSFALFQAGYEIASHDHQNQNHNDDNDHEHNNDNNNSSNKAKEMHQSHMPQLKLSSIIRHPLQPVHFDTRPPSH